MRDKNYWRGTCGTLSEKTVVSVHLAAVCDFIVLRDQFVTSLVFGGNVAEALPAALQHDSRTERAGRVKRASRESHEGGCHTVVTPPPLALKKATNTRTVFVVVTRLKFYEGDDRYFATTNDAGVSRTVIAGTAKYDGSAYFSHGRLASQDSCLQNVIVQISEQHRGV